MLDWWQWWIIIGPVVGILGIYVLCKVEPIGKPDDFGEFLLNTVMVAFVWFMMSIFWPLTLIIGGLWVVYEYLYGDSFKTAKASYDR